MSASGSDTKVSFRHLRNFIIVNPSEVISHSLLNDLLGRIRKGLGTVENIQSLASLELQIFRCIVLSVPGSEDDKRYQHAIE